MTDELIAEARDLASHFRDLNGYHEARHTRAAIAFESLADALTAAQAEAETLRAQLAAAEARGREMEAMKEDVRMAETYMGGRNGNIIRYAGDHRRTLSEMIVRLEAQVQREAREEMQSQVAAARAEGAAEGFVIGWHDAPRTDLHKPPIEPCDFAAAEKRIAARVVRGMSEEGVALIVGSCHTLTSSDPATNRAKVIGAIARAVEGETHG